MLFSCEDVTDFYLGIPMQPEFTENTFVEGMNIFGLLRPDDFNGFNKSFVYVQQNWPILEITDSSFNIIKQADIQLFRMENEQFADTINLPLMPPGPGFNDTLYRPQQSFNPVPGNTYRLICSHRELPTAIGETVFPSPPRIVSNSLKVNNGIISLDIESDPGIRMLDIYISGSAFTGITGRYVTSDSASVHVSFPYQGTGTLGIEIYGYDANLASYYSNSNTSLNFNKYRTTFSTLEEGFGVFGSLNRTAIEFAIPQK
jgi:hypothetical protein